ncbi:protein FATTY ACID EXPORT 1, chloroplastic-like [Solanum pennellii]|uniref:Protein FATTY ACID EXPORT 1, chloroplastic-like n=1 Tax=Solanum pennellii TaxID=28526 RepID=A0ABM1HQK2_SOLPN|nr:protein FATTY ACID EXPORT 1, chloroplastic-like [Solanum pennellii]XP_015088911.1 protein FATTY ACID EXPORT 1, chloroplastic-like [Solanum pennellii]
MSLAISQLSCFSSINRRLVQFHSRPLQPCSTFSLKVISMSNDGHGTDESSLKSRTTLSYATDSSQSLNGTSSNSYSAPEEYVTEKEINESVQENSSSQPKKAAKIHDFCLGIPFGGFVFTGGFIGFIFSRNPATLSSGVLFGGALLALSTISMKVWREGKTSFPFILGQAVLAATLLWKNMQTFSLTGKLFPTGFFAAISAAMFCFYSYVILSGGNPPPKKLKASTSGAY